ncbi:MAG TPA: FAD-linked oxidase C-terminal domain-containing protein [Vicinamibacteria bacterium]|nr:FAD-linked oxidase C-terminal domain-containing protein [Vicinamibacteria bacterium]
MNIAHELRERVEGEVRFDRYSRILYSTDASIYQIEPIGVVIPKHAGDVAEVIRFASREGIPVLPRGGGTSLAGQAVGEAIVIDFSKYMRDVVEVSREESWARVQPGIVHDVLGAHLKPYGLRFGPETATSNRANIGGMIGNNSAGARSLIYGKTVDNVLEVKSVLADGSTATFGSVCRSDLDFKTRGDGLEAAIYRTALGIAEAHRAEIEARYPKIPRRVSGYNLDELFDPREINLAKLVVGSEGTFASVVEAKLALAPLPPASGLAVLHFGGLLPALETGCEVLSLEPSAVELVDEMVMDLARRSLEYSRRMHFVHGQPKALIIVEFVGETRKEVEAKLDALDELVGPSGKPMVRVLEPEAQANVWKVRKAALPLLLGLPGDKKPIAFVEDTAVAPERVPDFIRRFEAILADHDTVGSFYAHAGAGCLHIRPLVNLKDGAEVRKMTSISEEVFALVIEFGGSMSGEHGDGLARSHFNERLFGQRLYRAFRELKAAFDPKGIMNPGKVVDAPGMAENLRYGESYRASEPKTAFPYSREGGFARAVELCNGSGVCRKNLEGTMCPSFMITRDEAHSTRGRANALRAVLDGRLPTDDMASERLYEIMDLCISCKGCKAECPSNVDLARLKSEFLALYHREHPYSLREKLLVRPEMLGRLGVKTRPLATALARQSWFRALLESLAGIDRRRTLMPFARETFESWFRRRAKPPRSGAKRVVLFHDTFMNYHEPDIGRSAVLLLEAAGYEVVLGKASCCGRPSISKGMLDRARKQASENVRALHPFVREGIPVVGAEPSCILGFRDEYPDLVPGEASKALADRSFLLEEFFDREGLSLDFPGAPGKLLVHGHCHLKALVGTESLVRFLAKLGGTVTIVDSGCCGMAGSFGFEKEHFDLSVQMAERRLAPAVRAASEDTTVVAPGTSCRHQIADLTGREAYHPVEVVARAAALV